MTLFRDHIYDLCTVVLAEHHNRGAESHDIHPFSLYMVIE